MRLGFWNRLALVVTVLVTIAMPLYAVRGYMNDQQIAKDSWFEMCKGFAVQAEAEANGKKPIQTLTQCEDERNAPLHWPIIDLWWMAALAGFVICAVTYGLLWISISIGRWVWRGRRQADG